MTPWEDRETKMTAVPVGSRQGHFGPRRELHDDDYVVVFRPRDSEVQRFLSRIASARAPKRAHSTAPTVCEPIPPYPALDVRNDLRYSLASWRSRQRTATWRAPTRTSSATAPTTGPHVRGRLQLVQRPVLVVCAE
jgi:hypothetical protein